MDVAPAAGLPFGDAFDRRGPASISESHCRSAFDVTDDRSVPLEIKDLLVERLTLAPQWSPFYA
jgi:hypothetical protein